ncbi:MAG: bifunctional phosphoserine phosphatase/homoserine phosphotransferase ThrH [Acidimicrobiales bacterium]
MSAARQRVVTLDMEGVVTPEIWIAVADHTGVEALRRTTRDEPDYQRLMDDRIAALQAHDITLPKVQAIIADLPLLDGAREFLDELRSRHQVILLSDTFEQFADPFMDKLGRPHLLCHRLVVDGDRSCRSGLAWPIRSVGLWRPTSR